MVLAIKVRGCGVVRTLVIHWVYIQKPDHSDSLSQASNGGLWSPFDAESYAASTGGRRSQNQQGSEHWSARAHGRASRVEEYGVGRHLTLRRQAASALVELPLTYASVSLGIIRRHDLVLDPDPQQCFLQEEEEMPDFLASHAQLPKISSRCCGSTSVHRDQQQSIVFPIDLLKRPHGQPAPDRQILKVPGGRWRNHSPEHESRSSGSTVMAVSRRFESFSTSIAKRLLESAWIPVPARRSRRGRSAGGVPN